jgi:acyl-CoA thioesterase I
MSHRLLLLILLCTIVGDLTVGQSVALSRALSPSPQIAAKAGGFAALGASETYGEGATPRTLGFAYLISSSLHAKRFVDAGIDGAPLGSAYSAELKQALSIHPWMCSVFFGFNDLRTGVSRTTFLNQLKRLVKALRKTHAHVLIIGLPDLSLLPAVSSLGIPGVSLIVQSWNAGMKSVARQTGSDFIGLQQYSRELATHPEYVANDGLHPSNAGHARLAQVITAKILADHLWKR